MVQELSSMSVHVCSQTCVRTTSGMEAPFAFLGARSRGAPPFENLLLESARTSGKIRLSSNLLYLSGGNAEFLRRAAVSLTHDA